jgi:hypothetical protein
MRLLAIAMAVTMAGCTTMGRTTTHQDSLLCVGFCMDTEFDSQVEIVKE